MCIVLFSLFVHNLEGSTYSCIFIPQKIVSYFNAEAVKLLKWNNE